LRRPVLAGLAAAAALALAGCGSIDAALSAQSVIVNFRPDASTAVIAAARRECAAPPGLRLAAAPAVPGPAGAPSSLHYDARQQASGAQLASLQACLRRTNLAPYVTGIAVKDAADQG
jgi:hypothetical protein